MKGRLMKKLTVLLVAGALVAIALPGVVGAQNFALLACSEGSHTDKAGPTAPLVDSCQASSGAAQAVCATADVCVPIGAPVNSPACTVCLEALADAGCKLNDVEFSCVGPVNRRKLASEEKFTVGVTCVKNFVFDECDDDDDD